MTIRWRKLPGAKLTSRYREKEQARQQRDAPAPESGDNRWQPGEQTNSQMCGKRFSVSQNQRTRDNCRSPLTQCSAPARGVTILAHFINHDNKSTGHGNIPRPSSALLRYHPTCQAQREIFDGRYTQNQAVFRTDHRCASKFTVNVHSLDWQNCQILRAKTRHQRVRPHRRRISPRPFAMPLQSACVSVNRFTKWLITSALTSVPPTSTTLK